MSETALAKLDAACRILAEVSAPFHLKTLRDDLMSIQHALKQRGASLDVQNRAAEFRLRVERKLGALLSETVVPRGHHGGVLGAAKSLPDGVTKKQSQRWQREARVPEGAFERYLAETRESGGELTSAGLLQVWDGIFGAAPAEFPRVDDDANSEPGGKCPACGHRGELREFVVRR